MFNHYIETSPFEPPDEKGFSKGIIHRSGTCSDAVGWMFPVFDDRDAFHHIKVGRNHWMKIKKDEPKCPKCYCENQEE